jgi:hypothetical protein
MRSYRLTVIPLLIALPACSKQDAPLNDTTAMVLAPAPAPAASDSGASAGSSSSTAPPTVRGTVTSVSDTALTVSTATGDVQVRIAPPLTVYTRTPSNLAHVTPTAFVGVTSVTAPDGSQRATEIHVFPEELRGTGEGSRMMTQASGGTTASGSRMTNGSVSPSRMTNGTVATKGGVTSLTVTYQGGSQTIAIPAGVTVTTITPTQQKVVRGANVIVLANKRPDGGLSASTVMLAAPASK